MIADPKEFRIADLCISLNDVSGVLGELRAHYEEFDRRADAFKSDARNPHLCAAGCSHCCKQGAVFAVTLAEAVLWAQAIHSLPDQKRESAKKAAKDLLPEQERIFATVEGQVDQPGAREEPLFSARISALNAALGPTCPLLVDDLCSVYEARPMLCRAYGFPVDAYAVKAEGALVFRSLCVLYENERLVDYVRADDLKARLAELSKRLVGGIDLGRFTSVEVVLSKLS